jgi:hypothetical protein
VPKPFPCTPGRQELQRTERKLTGAGRPCRCSPRSTAPSDRAAAGPGRLRPSSGAPLRRQPPWAARGHPPPERLLPGARAWEGTEGGRGAGGRSRRRCQPRGRRGPRGGRAGGGGGGRTSSSSSSAAAAVTGHARVRVGPGESGAWWDGGARIWPVAGVASRGRRRLLEAVFPDTRVKAEGDGRGGGGGGRPGTGPDLLRARCPREMRCETARRARIEILTLVRRPTSGASHAEGLPAVAIRVRRAHGKCLVNRFFNVFLLHPKSFIIL